MKWYRNSRIISDAIGILFILSLLSFWASASAMASASETPGQYIMTEQEWQILNNNLNRLEQISITQEQESKMLKESLTRSQEDLNRLRSQLTISSQHLSQAEKSLASANASLQRFAEEEKRTRLRVKAQRNAWSALAIISTVLLVARM